MDNFRFLLAGLVTLIGLSLVLSFLSLQMTQEGWANNFFVVQYFLSFSSL
jgi:hypothetical protein